MLALVMTLSSHVLPPRDEAGQSLAEYALILGLIAVVAIASLVFLGDVIADVMSMIGSRIDDATL